MWAAACCRLPVRMLLLWWYSYSTVMFSFVFVRSLVGAIDDLTLSRRDRGKYVVRTWPGTWYLIYTVYYYYQQWARYDTCIYIYIYTYKCVE